MAVTPFCVANCHRAYVVHLNIGGVFSSFNNCLLISHEIAESTSWLTTIDYGGREGAHY